MPNSEFEYFQIITADGLKDIEDQEPSPETQEEPKKKAQRPKRRYKYEGPVTYYGKCIAHCYKAETEAVSEAQARNNILCQIKLASGKNASAGGYRLVNKVYLVI